MRGEINEILEVHNESLGEKYLGMPTDVGTSVNGAFSYLKDRVWKKVQGWMELCLSAGGKEVLIKGVAQAIPTYSMSCFKLPRGLCKHIASVLCDFWWGSKEGKRRACWVAWDDMSKPKSMGGLGFRNIELFNLALLANQVWHLLQDLEALSARVLKAVYFPTGDLLDAELGASPSRVWHAMVDGVHVLRQGLIRRIGSEESTRIWNMPWIPRDGLMLPIRNTSSNSPQLVCELIDQASQSWNRQLVRGSFSPLDWELIKNIPLSTTPRRIIRHGTMRSLGFFQFDQPIVYW